MAKLELLGRIEKLSALVHGADLDGLELSAECTAELRGVLDRLTEEYLARYCETSHN